MWLCYNCSFTFNLLEAVDKMMDVIGPSPKKYILGAKKILLIKFFQKMLLVCKNFVNKNSSKTALRTTKV